MGSLLIVDDDVTIREVLLDLFSEEYSCFQTETAEEALELLDQKKIDVVLTDISMPGMSGLELLGQTRQRWPRTEVIMMSGITDEEYANGLVTMGAFDYMAKPFAMTDILRTVARAAEKSQRPSEEQTAHGNSETATDGPDENPMEVFSSIHLDKVFPLHELLEMSQRNRMTGYMKLTWNNTTIEKARSMEMFGAAGEDFAEALESRSAVIYLRNGLIIDAVMGEAPQSIYCTDAEKALAMVVRLATWVSEGVCASGYTLSSTSRPQKLSVSNNAGKFLSIVTREEEGCDFDEEGLNFENVQVAATEDACQLNKPRAAHSTALFTDVHDVDQSCMAYLV